MMNNVYLEPGVKFLTHVEGEDEIATVVDVQPNGVEVAFDSGTRLREPVHVFEQHLGPLHDCPVCINQRFWEEWENLNSF